MRLFVLTIILFFFITGVFAQNDSEKKDLKIGLVLSGGGAKGLAHIGVIKVLEEYGIVPQYITGTSMGSIVGGLYAIGYNAAEIDSIARNIDWFDVLSNKISLDQVAIEEKANYGRFIAEIPLTEKGFTLPRGLIEGHKLNATLNNLTRIAHHESDFSRFPIPFACVGADIEKGQPYVMRSGFLPEAIRASMAIPTIFTPVIVDDRFLVDGGLMRNFPVQECLEMGADIIIGVDVSSDFERRENLNSLVNVLTSSAFVMSVIDTREQRKLCDLLIQPDLQNYTAGDFWRTAEIIDIGGKAARKHSESLSALRDSLFPGERETALESLRPPEKYIFGNITVSGNVNVNSDLILGKLMLREDEPVSMSEVERNINRLFGTRFFERINYRIIDRDSLADLQIEVYESNRGLIGSGLYYNTDGFFGLNLFGSYRNFWLSNSKMDGEIVFSEQYKARGSYLKYLGPFQDKAIQLNMMISEDRIPIYNELRNRIAQFGAFWWEANIDFKNLTQRNLQYGFRTRYLYSILSPNIAGGEFREIINASYRQFIPQLYVERNTLDKWYYPSKGMFWNVQMEYAADIRSRMKMSLIDNGDSISLGLNSAREQEIVNLNIGNQLIFSGEFYQLFPIGKSVALEMQSHLNITTLKEEALIPNAWLVGGINPQGFNALPFYGAKAKEYYLPNLFYIRGAFRFEVLRKLYASTHVNYINSRYPADFLMKNVVSGDLDGKSFQWGGALSLGYDSFIGPLQLSVSTSFRNARFLPALQLGYAYRFPHTRPWMY
ncbi:MAG: patatin-like phospholipase family protein [Cyclobacteriaceae bacterium]|nr:patatin-like phospholipase family protein [Cyclobacteriaceae bacterium]